MTSGPEGRLGFMQGRLSPILNGRIQCFPWPYWRQEFAVAEERGWRLMEWTLDDERLHENPFMTSAGRAEIRALCSDHGVEVASLTGDCFMQAPFFRADPGERQRRLADLRRVVDASAELCVAKVVFPVVDDGRLEDERELDDLIEVMASLSSDLMDSAVRILFEADLAPERLASFIGCLDPRAFGINYDTGNSASLGYDAEEEVAAYGARIQNVHLKDRALGGGTVSLGEGDVDFPLVFQLLAGAGYAGNYVIQGARAVDEDHAGALDRYRERVLAWMESR